MRTIITKIKKSAREKSVEKATGWESVLTDIQNQIERLKSFLPIVERKIERGEPWPGTQSQGQDPGQQHSV